MDFLRAGELYNLNWNSTETVQIGEAKVPLPKIPRDKDILNYNKKTKDQKFIRTQTPKDIWYWSDALREEYIAAEWHKRLNGYWIFIKGEPQYIPGSFHMVYKLLDYENWGKSRL